jgi:hypothetical protein
MDGYKTAADLQALMNSAGKNGSIVLQDEYKLNVESKIILGWKKCQKAVCIDQEGIVFDGNNKKITLVLSQTPSEDTAVIEVSSKARYTHIKNLKVEVEYNGEQCTRTLFAIRNFAKNVKIENCRIKMVCNGQINMTAIHNEAAIDTTLESGADELIISDSHFTMHSNAVQYDLPQMLFGIRNNLGNSICVVNNYLFIQNRGNGENQQAIGVFNSGRYGRISNNNIKANGNHNVGKQLENCYTTGLVNHGEYLLLTANNIVGEWGGQCLGLVNHGNYMKAEGNKILSTHTIKGRTIRQYGAQGVIANNIVTSTSRNPRLIEIYSDNNLIQGNMIDVLLRNECYSGCGIVVTGSEQRNLRYVSVKNNFVRGAVDIGILLRHCEECAATDNIIEGVGERNHFVAVLDKTKLNKTADNIADKHFTSDGTLAESNLDESKIVSVY